MRISALAAAADLPVATVKYYLREGLLPEGERTAATQARYDESHVRRLRVIRALLGPAGLTIAEVKRVVAALDAPPESSHDLLGVAHQATMRPVAHEIDPTDAEAALRRWGWMPEEARPDPLTLQPLAEALDALHAAGFDLPPETIDLYAAHMMEIARDELRRVPADSREEAVRYVVLGTVLVEPLMLAMRRIAQQWASHERFGQPGTSDPGRRTTVAE